MAGTRVEGVGKRLTRERALGEVGGVDLAGTGLEGVGKYLFLCA